MCSLSSILLLGGAVVFWIHMYFKMVTIVFVCLVCSGVLILWGQPVPREKQQTVAGDEY